MATIEPSLARQTRARPKEVCRVIVRVQGDLDGRQAQLQALGFTIVRKLKLIGGYSASAPGVCIRRAARHAWIISIEPDAQMQTMATAK